MEKINIAELLKDCPNGMELDCTMYEDVSFVKIVDSFHYPIAIKTKSGFNTTLTKYGQNVAIDGAKCVIFPKGKTTWEGFVPPCKFKVGDRVKHKSAFTPGIIVKVTDKGYHIDYPIGEGVCYVNFALEKDYELVPNKFDITTLKPFESRVLVRDTNGEKWKSNFWGFYDSDHAINHPHECCGNTYRQCIPYEGNEHLLGKKDDCDEFYKTWK